MKATLKYSLFRRPQPTNEIDAIGFLTKGSTIEVQEVVQGKSIDNIAEWYKSFDGFYYWGGGLSKEVHVFDLSAPRVEPITFPPLRISWRDNFLGIEAELRQFTGKGIKVAVIDTGVDTSHPDISSNILLPKDFTQSDSPVIDNEGHGTAVAGIIGANSPLENGIIGVAPDCSIMPIKVIRNAFDRSGLQQNIVDAINYAIDNDANVINISLDLSDVDTTLLRNAITQAASKGIVLIASAGDVNELTELGVSFPGSDPNFISIGSTNSFFEVSILNKKPQRLDFLAGLKTFWTLSSKSEKYKFVEGSSFCAAFLSGLAALVIGRIKANQIDTKDITRAEILTELSKSTSDRSELHRANSFSFIKI